MNNALKIALPIILGTIVNLLCYPVFVFVYLQIYFALFRSYPTEGGFISPPQNDLKANYFFYLYFTFIASIIIGFLLSLAITIYNPTSVFQGAMICLIFALCSTFFFANPIITIAEYLMAFGGNPLSEDLLKSLAAFIYVFGQSFITGILVAKMNMIWRN